MQNEKKEEMSQYNSYVDGIPVKISEKYKPPMRITLPVSCLNCSPVAIVDDEYDFKMEERVLQRLSQMKKSRLEEREKRKERLKTKVEVCQGVEQFSKLSMNHTEVAEVEEATQILNPTISNPVFSDSILTPVCAKQNFPSPVPTSSHFNLSDFESDNSSPFDNMELKTINDMEILASILTNDNSKNSLNNNNHIGDKELGKNGLVLSKGHSDWGQMSLNGYNNHVYSSPVCNYPVNSPSHRDLEQYTSGLNSEYHNFYNYTLNDFSNQFGAGVSPEHASTSTSTSGCKEGPHIGKSHQSLGNGLTDHQNTRAPPSFESVPGTSHLQEDRSINSFQIDSSQQYYQQANGVDRWRKPKGKKYNK